MNKSTVQILESVTDLFIGANVAAPIIFALVGAIASIIRGVTGSGPSLAEIANILEQKLGQNDATIRAEIARMEAALDADA